jgi:hypothetical protein
MSGTLPWYVARASGLVAWALLAGSVVWGLLMTSRVIRRFARSSWLLDLHRWLAGLALVFTAIHVVAILGDTYIHFGLASVLIPLAANWHPVMVAYGIASLYLLLAIEVTSRLRRRPRAAGGSSTEPVNAMVDRALPAGSPSTWPAGWPSGRRRRWRPGRRR